MKYNPNFDFGLISDWQTNNAQSIEAIGLEPVVVKQGRMENILDRGCVL